MSSTTPSPRPARMLWALTLMLALAGPASAASTIVLRSDEWCPHACASDAPRPGYLVDIARSILEAQGYQVRYEVVSWSRLQVLTGQTPPPGETWAVLGLGRAEETTRHYAFPAVPAGRSPICFYTRSDSRWRFTGMEALAGQRLGVVNGYRYGPSIDAYLQAPPPATVVDRAPGAKAAQVNLRKLLLDRLDVMLDDRTVVKHARAALGHTAGVREAGCLPDDDPGLYIAFHRSQPNAQALAKLVSEGIKRLRASGELSRILARYGERDWQAR